MGRPRLLRRLATTIALVTVTATVTTARHPAAQSAGAGESAISGVVKDATTGEPIPDAIVQLGGGLNSQRQFTDARGRFVFAGLGRADFQIFASKTGYFDGGFGTTGELNLQARATIRLAAGQWYSTADILLARPGSISGIVTDERGEPVVGVYVRLLTRIRIGGNDHVALGELTLTDDRGMYRIGNLRPGRYLAMVPSVQASAPAATPFMTLLGASEQTLEKFRRADGTFADRPMIDVDDSTRVFVGGFPVPPPPVNGRAMGYRIAVSGGTSLAQAAPVVLDAGMDRTGVDIRLDASPVSRISGIVQGPPEAIAGLTVRLLQEGLEEVSNGGEAGTALVAPDGSFTFASVPAGNYTIDVPVTLSEYTVTPMGLGIFSSFQFPIPPGARPESFFGYPVAAFDGIGLSTGPISGRKFWARTSITVGARDVSNLVVTLRPVMTIHGRIVKEPDSNFRIPAPSAAIFSIESATGNPGNGQFDDFSPRDNSASDFTIEGVTPGLYLLRGSPSGWMIKSVLVGGREHMNTPIDTASADLSNVVVTFTNAVQALSGSVTKASGDPADDAAVILFPAEPEQWVNFGRNPIRIQTTVAATDGTFRFKAMPGGDYYAVAVPRARVIAWREPDFFMRAQAVATRLTIAWGEQKTVALKLVEVR